MRYVSFGEQRDYKVFLRYMARVAESLAELGQEKNLESLKIGILTLRHRITTIFNEYSASNEVIAHYSSKGWIFFQYGDDGPFFKKDTLIMKWREAVSAWKSSFDAEPLPPIDTINWVMSQKTS